MGDLVKNSFYSTVTIGLRFVSNAVLFIIIARVMGAEEFGRFAFAISFVGIFLVIVDYGFCLQIIRDVALMPANALALSPGMLNGKLLLSFLSTVIIIITVNLLNYPNETNQIVYILWLAFLFYSFGLFFNSIFRGLNKFQYEAYPTIVFNGLQLVLILALLFFGFKTLSISFAYLVSRIVYFFYSLVLVRKNIGRIAFHFDIKQGFRALKDSLPFGIHTILATLYFQLDTVFLSFFKGNMAVGHYQAAMRIVLASMIICDVITSSYFPVIARYFRTDKIAFKNTGTAFNKYLIVSGGAIAAGLLLYSDLVIGNFYGKGYEESILIMQLLSVVIFLRFAGGAYATMITVSDHQKFRAFGVGVSLFVNVVLNCILIPKYGATGAAIVSIITHLVLVILYALFFYKMTGDFLVSKYCSLGLMFIVISYIICHLLNRISTFASIFVFISTVVALFFVTLDTDEKRGLRLIMGRLF